VIFVVFLTNLFYFDFFQRGTLRHRAKNHCDKVNHYRDRPTTIYRLLKWRLTTILDLLYACSGPPTKSSTFVACINLQYLFGIYFVAKTSRDLTCNLDLRTWHSNGQGEPLSQISRSEVISFQGYCPYTQAHTSG